MATSGSRDFNLDVGEIIEEAFERCGLEVRTGYDARTARRSLNLMFAEWANRGINMWTVEQGTITLTQGQAQETLLPDVVDVLEIVLRRGNTDYEVERISRGDYVTLPNKTTQGRPSQFWFNRQISPVINLWAVPGTLRIKSFTTMCSGLRMQILWSTPLTCPLGFTLVWLRVWLITLR